MNRISLECCMCAERHLYWGNIIDVYSMCSLPPICWAIPSCNSKPLHSKIYVTRHNWASCFKTCVVYSSLTSIFPCVEVFKIVCKNSLEIIRITNIDNLWMMNFLSLENLKLLIFFMNVTSWSNIHCYN